MARPLFSVRLPRELADFLDHVAEHSGKSRSDVVEMLINSLDPEDCELALKTTVPGSFTEKRNLRLSPESLSRLKQFAWDFEPVDFLRRLLAYLFTMAPDWQQPRPAQNDHEDAPARSRRRRRVEHADVDGAGEVATGIHASAAALVFLAICLVGAVVTLIMWLTLRTDPSAGLRQQDSGGQLPPASTEMGAA